MKRNEGSGERAEGEKMKERGKPTKSSMNSEPAMEKNGTRDSPAIALAKRVFPVVIVIIVIFD